jgi:hypothetical protein
MGNKQPVNIVGEVDFRVVRLSGPWFRGVNIGLRYGLQQEDQKIDRL